MTKQSLKKLNNSLKDFVNTIEATKFLRYNKDTKEVLVGSTPLTGAELQQLSTEIDILKNGLFWKFLVKDVTVVNNAVLIDNANSTDDIVFNRAVKYVMKVFTEVINTWHEQIK